MNTQNIDDGGAAFPTNALNVPFEQADSPKYQGMSLRDWFAGQALAGEMASQSSGTGEWATNAEIDNLVNRSKLFYRWADAMLRARKGGAK